MGRARTASGARTTRRTGAGAAARAAHRGAGKKIKTAKKTKLRTVRRVGGAPAARQQTRRNGGRRRSAARRKRRSGSGRKRRNGRSARRNGRKRSVGRRTSGASIRILPPIGTDGGNGSGGRRAVHPIRVAIDGGSATTKKRRKARIGERV